MAEVIDLRKCIYQYDKDADVLYVNFGNNRPSKGEMLNNYDVVRLDPLTNELVGVTIVFFNKRYHIKPNQISDDLIQNLLSPFRNVKFVNN